MLMYSRAISMSYKIYFCGSIRGGRDDQLLYSSICEMLRGYGQVLTEHVGDDNPAVSLEAKMGRKFPEDPKERDLLIFQTDMSWLNEADIVIAEVTNVSMGVGFELGAAWKAGKRVVCLLRKHKQQNLSAMVAGCSDFEIVEYESAIDLQDVFSQLFS